MTTNETIKALRCGEIPGGPPPHGLSVLSADGQTDDAHDRLEQEYNLAALALNSARVPLALDSRQLPMVARIAWLLCRERGLREALQKISKHAPMARSEAEGFRSCLEIATEALTPDSVKHGWIPGPPPDVRGRYWVVWKGWPNGVRVEAVELSPALIYQDDPAASLQIKTLSGRAYHFRSNQHDITHHMPIETPVAP